MHGSIRGSGSATSAGLLPPYAVIACSVVFYWSISVRALIYTLMPAVAADLGISSATAGVAIAGMLLGYCAGSWIAGWLPGSRKSRILAGVLLSLPSAALVSIAGNVWMLLAAALMVGFGVGIYIPLGLALIVDVGRGRAAGYMAFHEFSATLASFSGSAAVAVLLVWFDWHGSILLWCAVGVLATLVFLPVRDERGQARRRGAAESIPVDPLLAYSTFAYGVGTVLVMGLISVLPLIMVRGWGLEQAHAASVVGNTRLAGLVGVAAVGLVADRWGHRRVLVALLMLSMVGCLAMSVGGYGPLFVPGMLLLAAGAAGSITLLPLVIAEAYPRGQRERALAVAGGFGGLLGLAAAPAFFGFLLDAGTAEGPVLISSLLALLAVLATLRIARRPEPVTD